MRSRKDQSIPSRDAGKRLVRIGRRFRPVLFTLGILGIALSSLVLSQFGQPATKAKADYCTYGSSICAPTPLTDGSVISDTVPGGFSFITSTNWYYEIEISANSDFSSPVFTDSGSGTYSGGATVVSVSTPLDDGDYYWRGAVCNWYAMDNQCVYGTAGGGWADNGAPGSGWVAANGGAVAFTVNTATGASVTGDTSVTGGAATGSTTPGPFTFSTPYSTAEWKLQITTHSDFTSPVIDVHPDDFAAGSFSYSIGDSTGLTYDVGSSATTLSTEGSYYWRVLTCAPVPEDPTSSCVATSTDLSAWSEANSGSAGFIVDTTGPDKPTFSTPTTAEIFSTYTPTFTSSAVAGMVHGTHVASQWQVGTVSDFTSGVILDPGDDTSHKTSLVYPGSPTALVANTTYYVRVRYKDSLGNYSSWADGVSFSVDGDAPSKPSITTPSNGQHIQYDYTTYHFESSTPTDNVDVTNAEWEWDNVDTFDSEYLTDTVDNTYLGYALGPNNGGGNHYVRVRYQDAAGNWSSWSDASNYTADNTPPSISVLDIHTDNPYHSTIARKGSTITVAFTSDEGLDDGTNFDAPTVKLNGSVSFTMDSASGNDYSFSLALNPSTSYTSPSTIVIDFNDYAGNNFHDDTNTIVIDQTEPSAPSVTPAAASTVYTNASTFIITGTTEANNLVTVYPTNIDPNTICTGSPWGEPSATEAAHQQLSGGDTDYSIEVSVSADASHCFLVSTQDPAGNNSTGMNMSGFIIQDSTAPPTPSITDPADSSYIAGYTITLTGSSYADTNPQVAARWEIDTSNSFDSVAGDPAYDTGTDLVNLASYSPGTLADNQWYARVKYRDAALNWSSWSTAISFTVDNTAPGTPDITAPTDGSYTNDSTPTLTSSAYSDANPHLASQWELDLVNTFASGSLVNSGTDTVNLLSYTPGGQADALWYARVRHQDSSGNWSSWSTTISFTVDTVKPSTPSIASPASLSYTNDNTPTITGSTYSDVNGQLAAQWQIDTINSFDSGDLVDSGTDLVNLASYTPSTLSDAEWFAWVRYKDVAGNWSDWSTPVSFTVDVTNPTTPSITYPANTHVTTDTTPTITGSTYSDTNTQLAAQWQIDTSSSFNTGSLVDSGTDLTNLLSYTTSTLAEGLWYAQVRYQDTAENWSDWSSISTFIVDTTGPDKPSITAPTAASTTHAASPTITASAYSNSNDASAGLVSPVDIGTNPYDVAVSPDGAFAYASNFTDGTVSRIRTSDDTVVAGITVGANPIGVAFSQDGAFAYVTNSGAGTVSRIRTSDDTVTATITVGTVPYGVSFSPDSVFAYVTNGGDGTVSRIRTSDDTVTATITVGSTPRGVAIAANGAFAYAANSGPGTVSRIRTSDDTVTATITVGTAPVGLEVSSDNSFAYVTNGGDGTVSRIRTSDDTVTATITVGSGPSGVAISKDTSFAYATNTGAGTVSRIQTSDDTVTATVTVGTTPQDVSLSPDGSFAYVVNYGSNTVSRVETGSSMHLASQWQLDSANTFDSQSGNPKLDSGTDTAHLTSYVPTSPLPEGSWYVRVRYQESTGNWSDWSDPLQFNEAHISNVVVTTDNPSGDNGVGIRGGHMTVNFDLSGTPSSTPDVKLGASVPLTYVSDSAGHYVYTFYFDPNAGYSTPLSVDVTAPFTGGWNATDSSQSISIQPHNPNKPSITSPTEGATVITGTPTITSSAFTGYYTHAATKWQLDTVDSFDSGDLIDSGDDVVNLTSYITPALSDGTWYVRMTFADSAVEYSPWSDTVSFIVDTSAGPAPTLSFSLSGTNCSLGDLNPGSTSHCTQTISIATNATSGYTLNYSATDTLTSGSDSIAAMGTSAGSSQIGTPQFGMNLAANTGFGADPSGDGGSTGTVSAQYNTPDAFAFSASGAEIASSTGPSTATTFTASYITNVGSDTPAGTYATTVIYSLVPSY
ncbi:MAG: beta-propeller fold lactonase family protein [bacterium]